MLFEGILAKCSRFSCQVARRLTDNLQILSLELENSAFHTGFFGALCNAVSKRSYMQNYKFRVIDFMSHVDGLNPAFGFTDINAFSTLKNEKMGSPQITPW